MKVGIPYYLTEQNEIKQSGKHDNLTELAQGVDSNTAQYVCDTATSLSTNYHVEELHSLSAVMSLVLRGVFNALVHLYKTHYGVDLDTAHLRAEHYISTCAASFVSEEIPTYRKH